MVPRRASHLPFAVRSTPEGDVMSWEIVALVAIGVAAGLFVWKELRGRKLGAMNKRVKALEVAVAQAPGEEALAEIDEKLRDLESKLLVSAPAGMKQLVDRVNMVSNDATLLKTVVEDVKNRVARLESTSKHAAAWSKELSRG